MFLLNVLGIIIGIAAIVALISVGDGMQASIEDAFEDFGADKIIVMAGGFQGPATGMGGEVSLEDDDIKLIEKISGVASATGMVYSQYPIEYRGDFATVYVSGLESDDAREFFEDIASFEFESGRYYKKGETRAVVIGSIVKTKFDRDIDVGDTIEIKGSKFKVVGVLKSTGSPQDDNMIMMSVGDYRDLFGKTEELTMIYASASNVDNVDRVAEKIEEKLDDKYGEDVFSAITTEQLADQIAGIFDIISLVLAGIASISLVVAGVGIANTMLMSVMERTREIGIMKAIGATDYQIMEIFLIESGMLGFFGGLIGVIVGALMSAGISFYGSSFFIPINTSVSLGLAIFALSFSVLAGIISGVWPARKAAKMNPVDALRYE
ncbi:MAG: ABC transporter permease [Nanoarchaeota archaeon]|nr:ABC transporter permease [Nanoarchaeota archaeon]